MMILIRKQVNWQIGKDSDTYPNVLQGRYVYLYICQFNIYRCIYYNNQQVKLTLKVCQFMSIHVNSKL